MKTSELASNHYPSLLPYALRRALSDFIILTWAINFRVTPFNFFPVAFSPKLYRYHGFSFSFSIINFLLHKIQSELNSLKWEMDDKEIPLPKITPPRDFETEAAPLPFLSLLKFYLHALRIFLSLSELFWKKLLAGFLHFLRSKLSFELQPFCVAKSAPPPAITFFNYDSSRPFLAMGSPPPPLLGWVFSIQ